MRKGDNFRGGAKSKEILKNKSFLVDKSIILLKWLANLKKRLHQICCKSDEFVSNLITILIGFQEPLLATVEAEGGFVACCLASHLRGMGGGRKSTRRAEKLVAKEHNGVGMSPFCT